jgi:hypothetical protein
LSLADVIATFANIPAQKSFLSKVQSVDQRMRLAVSAFADCGCAVAHTFGAAMGPYCCKSLFWGVERKFLEPLMRLRAAT